MSQTRAVWQHPLLNGNFDGSSNPALVGRTAAAPLFFEIVDALAGAFPDQRFADAHQATLNLRKVDVCASTGDLPGKYCPQTKRSWFIPGISPITVSKVHRAIRIDSASGERSCSFNPATTHLEVFESCPSDILKLFRQAGISIRSPPHWTDGCTVEAGSLTGIAPRITSPSYGLTYQLRPNQIDADQIALKATTDGDVDWLFWFANDRFIAKARRDEPYIWQAGFGEYHHCCD